MIKAGEIFVSDKKLFKIVEKKICSFSTNSVIKINKGE